MRMKRDKTEKRRLLQIMTSEIAASCWSHLCNWPAINCWYFDLSIMAHFAQEHWLYSILLPSSSHLHSSFQMNSGLWLMLNKLPRVSIHLPRQPAGTTFIAIKFKLSAIFAAADQLKAELCFELVHSAATNAEMSLVCTFFNSFAQSSFQRLCTI